MKGKLLEPTTGPEDGIERIPFGLDLKGRDRDGGRGGHLFLLSGFYVTFAIILQISNSTFVFSSPFMFTFHFYVFL